jgi:hypothetical protein
MVVVDKQHAVRTRHVDDARGLEDAAAKRDGRNENRLCRQCDGGTRQRDEEEKLMALSGGNEHDSD